VRYSGKWGMEKGKGIKQKTKEKRKKRRK